MSQTTGIVLFVVGILVSIMIHEWGHFWTARRFGMRADRYFLGFGPTLWSTRRGETEYGVKALPLGGFVRILGMSPGDRRLPGVADQWLDPARHEATPAARDEGGANTVLEGHSEGDVPTGAVPGSLPDLAVLLARRGTPPAVTEAILRDVGDVDGAPTDESRDALERAIDRHVPKSGTRTGDTGGLRHRLQRGDAGRFFGDKPSWQRAVVLAAGSALHFAIAFVLLFGGLLLLPQATGDVTRTIGDVWADTPAATAGLQVGDEVVQVNDVASDDFMVLRDELRANADQEVTLVVQRAGERLTIDVTPDATVDGETGETVGVVGFVPEAEVARLDVGSALYETFAGPSSIPRMAWYSLTAVGSVFGPEGIGALFNQILGTEARTTDGGISMVGGATVTGQGVATYGVMFLVSMLVSINVFIGVFNILPLPPLDGGHLAVLAVEKGVNVVRGLLGRPATFRVRHETVATIAIPVLLVIATVGLGLVWLDITSPLELP